MIFRSGYTFALVSKLGFSSKLVLAPSWLIGCAVSIALAVALIFPNGSSAAEYQLAAQDKVRVKVVEWRAGRNEFHEWSSIGGEYSIASSGGILLPLLGEIPAEGRTTAQLSAAIA